MRVLIDLVVNHTSKRARVVPGRAPRPPIEVPRLVRLVEEEAAAREPGHGLPGVQKTTWSYDKEARLITSTASTISSPTSTPPIRWCSPRS
jgi:maltose alpha-D-glucosyltransferase/alpha-amylase